MRLSAQLNNAATFELQSEDGAADDEDDETYQQAAWVWCSDLHQKLFLHHEVGCSNACGRTFAQACPAILMKLLNAMHSSKLAESTWRSLDSSRIERPQLNIRCLEFHNYKAGGGLTDAGHIDVGSTVTLSVQLSDPGGVERGGRFTTTDADGVPTMHELARGDAICFCSETVHNVDTLKEGTRNSLVIELWTDPANRRDRHH